MSWPVLEDVEHPCGLSVVVVEAEVRYCLECDHREVTVPDVAGLMTLLASDVVRRKGPLTGRDARLLRQCAGLDACDLAALCRVDEEDVACWELEVEPVPRDVAAMLRALGWMGANPAVNGGPAGPNGG